MEITEEQKMDVMADMIKGLEEALEGIKIVEPEEVEFIAEQIGALTEKYHLPLAADVDQLDVSGRVKVEILCEVIATMATISLCQNFNVDKLGAEGVANMFKISVQNKVEAVIEGFKEEGDAE